MIEMMEKKIPLHIKAKVGDIAEKIIISGDPYRVKQMSTMIEGATLVNENRGYLVYTGKYNGGGITLACHGIGAPSAAIVIEELIMLGGKAIIRLGTAGGLLEDMKYGDLLIANGAFMYAGGTVGQYVRDIQPPTVPTYGLFNSLIEAAVSTKAKVFVGPVFSGDAFYAEDKTSGSRLSSLGYYGVEMEAGALFALSMIRGFSAGAIFMISNNILQDTQLIDATKLRSYVDRAAKVALDALTNYRVTPSPRRGFGASR